jgi:hypothetical protein
MLRKLAAGTSAAFVAAGLAAGPALASRLPHPGDTCSGPATEQNGLDKHTTPADGSIVRSGDTIDVTLQWDKGVVDSAVLDRALDCVQIDGQPAPGLSLDQGQVPNLGHLTHRYRIPARLAPGTEVCDQGFVFGPPADVPQRLSSNRVCFTVSSPPTPPADTPETPRPTTPETAPPASGGSPEAPGSPSDHGPGPGGGGGPGPSGSPPSGDTAQPPPSTFDTPPVSPPAVPGGPALTPTPVAAGPADIARAANGSPEAPPSSPPPLPVTGHDPRPLAVAGGVNLVAAGLAFIGGARRRRRRLP